MSFEAVDIFVKDTTLARNPVPGAVVKVLSSNGAVVYGLQSTDANGRASFLLPSEFSYQLRAYKFGYSFGQPQLFSVLPAPEMNVFDVAATNIAPPVPNDSRLCTAYGYFRDITGAPQANVEIHFIAKFDPALLEGAAVLKERIIIRTDERGYAQVNLIRNAQYQSVVQGAEDVVRQIDVPDAPNVNLPDLLFPVVSKVVAIPAGPYTLAVGDSLPVELHVMTSDGNDLGKGFGDAYYRSSNGEVLGFSFDATHIILYGSAPGVAQVEITRADRSIVRIPDAGIEGQPLVVTVTP